MHFSIESRDWGDETLVHLVNAETKEQYRTNQERMDGVNNWLVCFDAGLQKLVYLAYLNSGGDYMRK